MTRRNEVMPRPSHPRRRKSRLGIKIRAFIEETNRSIIRVKRGRRGSWLI